VTEYDYPLRLKPGPTPAVSANPLHRVLLLATVSIVVREISSSWIEPQ
jgi:hypothetical protein